MIKTTKSKYAKDALLISVSMVGCLLIYFLAAYFFITGFRLSLHKVEPGFSLLLRILDCVILIVLLTARSLRSETSGR
jgi:hypothetical protein